MHGRYLYPINLALSITVRRHQQDQKKTSTSCSLLSICPRRDHPHSDPCSLDFPRVVEPFLYPTFFCKYTFELSRSCAQEQSAEENPKEVLRYSVLSTHRLTFSNSNLIVQQKETLTLTFSASQSRSSRFLLSHDSISVPDISTAFLTKLIRTY